MRGIMQPDTLAMFTIVNYSKGVMTVELDGFHDQDDHDHDAYHSVDDYDDDGHVDCEDVYGRVTFDDDVSDSYDN